MNEAAEGKARQLGKGLGLVHIFSLASGAMISSGLFILPGLAYAQAGPAVVVSYFLAGLFATTGMLSIAELTTAMPRAGGDYFFVTRGMGPGVGTVAGLLTWFSLSLKSAFALVGMGAFAALAVGVGGTAAAAVLCVGFMGLNLVGTREAAWVQVGLVAALLVLMAVYVGEGVFAVKVGRFEPFAPHGLAAVLSTAGLVFVSYGGLLKIASMAEEVRNPGRNIPLGLILSLVVVTVLYTLMVFVTTGVMEGETLSGSRTPISDGAAAFLGRGGAVALGIGAVLAFVSTANAGIMAASRYLLALSRDGLLPRRLSAVNRRFGTPHVAVLLTGGFVLVSLLLDLRILVESASTVLLLSYLLANLSVIVLRESGVQNYRPSFRSPLYPFAQVVGALGSAFLIFEMGEEAFAISAVLVLAGFATYWFYGRRGGERESALLHLIERLTAKELVRGSLEAELKQIIRERDEIVEDRFDRVIEACPVLDCEGPTSAGELFARVGEALGPRLGVEAGQLRELLVAREAESSTVLGPGLAIPHVVVEGEGKFEVLLARCRQGVRFSPQAPAVRAVFVLVGTRDERNFHLRALSAVAQVVQDPDFEGRWRAARGEQALRDVVLLAKRRRHQALTQGAAPLS
ncbi:MAG: amino acid permease [Candidatus Brocadiia bacterium]